MKIETDCCVIVVVRHGRHQNNVLIAGEAKRLRKQGERLRARGLTPDVVAVTLSSPSERAQASLQYLQEGLGVAPNRAIIHPALGPLSAGGPSVPEVAQQVGLPMFDAVATHRGHLAITAAGIATPDRLFRALQTYTVWETLTRLYPGRAVVMVSHSGSRIEPAICLAQATASRGQLVWREEDLPDPQHFLEEGEAALLRFKNGRLQKVIYVKADV